MTAGGAGGLVFDYYGPSDYKFVRVDAIRDVVEVGHVDPKRGVTINKTYIRTLDDTSPQQLEFSFVGASVSISGSSATLGTYGFNAALVDGQLSVKRRQKGQLPYSEPSTKASMFEYALVVAEYWQSTEGVVADSP